jgi:hypothetical protein
MPAPAGTQPELFVSGRLMALTNGETLSGGTLVARERYSQSPTQFERLFSTTYRTA